MNIKKEAAKIAVKTGTKGLKKLIEPIRKRLTKSARKRRGKEIINPYVLAFALLSASGCASIDRALIAVDDGLYGSSTALVAVPPGYDARPYVIDAGANRVDVDGWQVKWEIVPSASFSATMLSDAIAKPRRQSVMGPVMELINDQPGTTPESSGASAAVDLLKDEAAKEGLQ